MCLDAASYLVEIGSGHVIRQGTIGELRLQGQLSAIISQDDTLDSAPEETPASCEKFPDVANEADMDTSNEGSSNGDENTPLHNGNIGKLVDEEARAEGRVSLWTYWTYIRCVMHGVPRHVRLLTRLT